MELKACASLMIVAISSLSRIHSMELKERNRLFYQGYLKGI